MNEQVFACQLVHNTEFFRAGRVCACESVKNKNFAVLQVSGHFVFDRVELFAADRHVHAAPCDLVMHAGRVDDKFILRGTPRIFTGRDGKSALIAQNAFAPSQRGFHKRGGGQVAVNCRGIQDPQFFQTVSLHHIPPKMFL